ncbi:hypothetical protein [Microvirga lotononidis]|uniref:Uncharacterized protein n=1 Tax=Microvirga lotononidis TaxID=864069 RepID=I4YP74_9HYPH|nr:hypothetical protein [Microvirga lotononidis]EIM25766.1 hypothetical protein MicloDRAFT_00064930 [Microvirga lotononidis]WQO25693.1 hypothetical protein U0023_13295 [Microvirga lotononidis]
MTGRVVAVLVGLLCLLALGWETHAQPKRQLHPSKLEKTCPYQGAWMPCFIRDEALSQQWDV